MSLLAVGSSCPFLISRLGLLRPTEGYDKLCIAQLLGPYGQYTQFSASSGAIATEESTSIIPRYPSMSLLSVAPTSFLRLDRDSEVRPQDPPIGQMVEHMDPYELSEPDRTKDFRDSYRS